MIFNRDDLEKAQGEYPHARVIHLAQRIERLVASGHAITHPANYLTALCKSDQLKRQSKPGTGTGTTTTRPSKAAAPNPDRELAIKRFMEALRGVCERRVVRTPAECAEVVRCNRAQKLFPLMALWERYSNETDWPLVPVQTEYEREIRQLMVPK